MTGSLCRRLLMLVALTLAVALPAAAADRPFDRDWRTGVTVAPGALTWTDDHLEDKKNLINQTASGEGRTCTHHAFLAWPPGHGGGEVILAKTRANYEAAGYTVTEKHGHIPTDVIWTVSKDGREAVILWNAVAGTTIYFSCLTAGSPAADPERWLVLGALAMLGLAGVLGGYWLVHRTRAQGLASLAWPATSGSVKSSAVQSYKTKGGPQFVAKVAYDYTVDGKSYAGDRVRFGNYAGAQAAAEADIARYPEGSAVDVRYDPANPSVSTLEAGTRGHNVLGLVLCITGALIVGVAALIAVIS